MPIALCALAVAAHAASPPAPGPFERALAAGDATLAAHVADSLVRAREVRDRWVPERAASALDSLGRKLFMTGTPEAMAAAEPLFRGGLARRERAYGSDDPRVAGSLANLATLLDYLGRFTDALPLAERAVALRTRGSAAATAEAAASLRQLGMLRFELGDYAGAGEPMERALAILTALPGVDPSRLADAHNNLGELERVRDHLAAAEGHFRAGLDLARERLAAGDPMRLALANNLAGLYKDLARFDEAEPLLEDVLATLQHSDDPGALATARLNLAEVLRLQDRPEVAEPLYRLALEGARGALGPEHPDLVPFLNQTAVCEQVLGRFARADSLDAETGSILLATLGPDHPLLAQHLHDRARREIAAGRAADADSLLRRALAIREARLGPRHPEVALVLVDLARALRREHARGHGREADSLLARSLVLLEASGAYPDAQLEAHADRAEALAAAGRLADATAEQGLALALLDSLRVVRGGDETRAAFVAGRLDLFDRMVRWQLARGNVGDALAAHERGRARVLLDALAESGVDLLAGVPDSLASTLASAERDAESRLAASQRALQDAQRDPTLGVRERLELTARLGARADSASAELAQVRRRIRHASPVWRGVLSADGQPASTEALRRSVVPPDGLLLVYHVGERESGVFALDARGRVEYFPLTLDAMSAARLGERAGAVGAELLERVVTGAPDRPGLATLLAGTPAGGYVLLPLRSRTGPDSLELRLDALARIALPARLRSRVLRAAEVAIVPDGALGLVPFEALVVEPRGPGRDRTRYWLDAGPAIAYGASATSLRNLALRPAPPPRTPGVPDVLSVSDVAYGAATDSARGASRAASRRARAWPTLPGTARETEAIRTAFGLARVTALTGAGAQELAVRAALDGRRFVHIATHGFAEDAGGHVLAGLVLAPSAATTGGAAADGMLDLFEIHRLHLDCEIAVLSACETAKGPRVAGEGAMALTRAFLVAGARRVVGSLWAVSDESSAVLVGGLFQRLARDEQDGRPLEAAIALRDARRVVRDDPRWGDPFYWAPLVLSGR